MSTRCQVQVVEVGENFQPKISLYHHTDGYPDYIIPLIYEAYCWRANENGQWRKARAGKVASLLCWADPGVFEPEVGNDVHWDNSYYYRLYCSESNNERKAIWEVEVYRKKELTIEEFKERIKINIFDYIAMHKECCKTCGATIQDRMLNEFVVLEVKQNIEDLIEKYR